MKYAKDQKTGDMGFDGMNNTAVKGSSTKYAHNQFTGHSNDGRAVQMRQSPNRKGNDGECHDPISGGSTKRNRPPASVPDTHPKSAPGMPQVRNPGGTRTWQPSAGQNYKGNPDSINMGRGPTKGNQQ